jgi:hypothetical protein
VSVAIRLLDPTVQSRHALHGETRIWAETNCYVDLWVELLHGLGLDPVVALGFALGIEFEGDQWSFIKYPLADLRAAYGLDVIELALWRPMEAHLREQLQLGRPVIVEVDSFHLPDTRATAYRSEHVKSSIAVTGIDPEGEVLEYFHGQGHFVLDAQDYRPVLRIGDPQRFTGDVLPPYVEIVKTDRQVRLTADGAQRVATELAREHFTRRRPAADSADTFRTRLVADAPQLLTDLPAFHAYAFATVRQLGAASELSGDLFDLLAAGAGTAAPACAAVADRFRAAAQACKGLQFKLARLAAGRTVELAPAVDDALAPWLDAMEQAGAALAALDSSQGDNG